MTCRAGTRDAEDPLSLVAGPADREEGGRSGVPGGLREMASSNREKASAEGASRTQQQTETTLMPGETRLSGRLPSHRPDPSTSGPGLGAGSRVDDARGWGRREWLQRRPAPSHLRGIR